MPGLYAYCALLLGLKMLPGYQKSEYEDFYSAVEKMPEAEQKKVLRQAVIHVPLDKDERAALLSFCEDKNKVAVSETNIKNFSPGDIVDMLVAVAFEYAKLKINLISDREKKN